MKSPSNRGLFQTDESQLTALQNRRLSLKQESDYVNLTRHLQGVSKILLQFRQSWLFLNYLQQPGSLEHIQCFQSNKCSAHSRDSNYISCSFLHWHTRTLHHFSSVPRKPITILHPTMQSDGEEIIRAQHPRPTLNRTENSAAYENVHGTFKWQTHFCGGNDSKLLESLLLFLPVCFICYQGSCILLSWLCLMLLALL